MTTQHTATVRVKYPMGHPDEFKNDDTNSSIAVANSTEGEVQSIDGDVTIVFIDGHALRIPSDLLSLTVTGLGLMAERDRIIAELGWDNWDMD